MSKWVLVTGAAQRIGRAISFELAAGGWNVVVHYNKSQEAAKETAKLVESKGRKAHLAACDFSDQRATEAYLASFKKNEIEITALVNNASLFEPDALSQGGGDQKQVNYGAPRILSESFQRSLARTMKGSIVNLLDASMPTSGFSAYSQSKKSLHAMTLEMAYRFAPNMRVNGVAPGLVLPNARETEAHFKKSLETTLLKAEITVEQIAAAVRFLIDNVAITGEILHVDGGLRLTRTPEIYRL